MLMQIVNTNIGLLVKSFTLTIFIVLASIYVFTWASLGVLLIVGNSYRVYVDKVFLDDLNEHNVTLYNVLYLSLLHVGNLTIVAHTSNETLVLSDEYNPLLHFPLIISGMAKIVYVNGELRLGLDKAVLKRLGITADHLSYRTCFPNVLLDSITVLECSKNT